MINQWRECLNWLTRCDALPSNSYKKFKTEGPDGLFECADMLRSGVILCNLLNKICPNILNIKQVKLNPQAKVFCLQNISLFLQTCEYKFGLNCKEMFEPDMLYDLTNISRVIKSLSLLSKTTQALKITSPFEYSEENELKVAHNFNTEFECFAEEYDVTVRQNILDEYPVDELYEQLCTPRRASHQALLASPKDKREHCIRELVETENNYVKALKDVVNNYMTPMKGVLQACDIDKIYGKIEILIEIHEKFEKRLAQAVSQTLNFEGNETNKLNKTDPTSSLINFDLMSLENDGDGRKNEFFNKANSKILSSPKLISNRFSLTNLDTHVKRTSAISLRNTPSHNQLSIQQPKSATYNIGECFLEFVDKLLIYGEYCTHLGRSQAHIDKMIDSYDDQFRNILLDCQTNASQGKFHLRDLIALPMQRILKYHILIKELVKYTPDGTEEKRSLCRALESMLDLTEYINELKRDTEDLELTNGIQKNILSLDTPDKKPLSIYGRLIKDGLLKVKGLNDNRLKMRYVFLFDTIIMFCKPIKSDSYSYKEAISILNYNIDLPQMPDHIRAEFTNALYESVQFSDNFNQNNNTNKDNIHNNNNYHHSHISFSTLTKHDSTKSTYNSSKKRPLLFDVTQTDWWKSKYKKRGGVGGEIKWTHGFTLSSYDKSFVFNVYAKTCDSWIKWLQAITLAKDNYSPKTLNTINDHAFQYVTFAWPTRCTFCKKLLKGAIYQGYKCQVFNCGYVAHKQCIQLINDQCEPASNTLGSSLLNGAPPAVPVRTFDECKGPEQSPLRNLNLKNELNAARQNLLSHTVNRHGNSTTNPPTSSNATTLDALSSGSKNPRRQLRSSQSSKSQNNKATNALKYSHNASISTPLIKFQQTNSPHFKNDNCDETIAVSTTKPGARKLLSPKILNGTILPANPNSLATFDSHESYYNLNIEKKSMVFRQDESRSGQSLFEKQRFRDFLVRESANQNGAVISLKYKNDIKHIKILHCPDGYYLAERDFFPTIVDLISHYQSSSLARLFNGVDTTLAYPYTQSLWNNERELLADQSKGIRNNSNKSSLLSPSPDNPGDLPSSINFPSSASANNNNNICDITLPDIANLGLSIQNSNAKIKNYADDQNIIVVGQSVFHQDSVLVSKANAENAKIHYRLAPHQDSIIHNNDGSSSTIAGNSEFFVNSNTFKKDKISSNLPSIYGLNTQESNTCGLINLLDTTSAANSSFFVNSGLNACANINGFTGESDNVTDTIDRYFFDEFPSAKGFLSEPAPETTQSIFSNTVSTIHTTHLTLLNQSTRSSYEEQDADLEDTLLSVDSVLPHQNALVSVPSLPFSPTFLSTNNKNPSINLMDNRQFESLAHSYKHKAPVKRFDIHFDDKPQTQNGHLHYASCTMPSPQLTNPYRDIQLNYEGDKTLNNIPNKSSFHTSSHITLPSVNNLLLQDIPEPTISKCVQISPTRPQNGLNNKSKNGNNLDDNNNNNIGNNKYIGTAIAQYNYKANDPARMISFSAGDKILIVEKPERSDWWKGQLLNHKEVGFFPKHYVREETP